MNFSQIIAKRAGVERIRLLRASDIGAFLQGSRWSEKQRGAPLFSCSLIVVRDGIIPSHGLLVKSVFS
jgi:hypothetical protein